MRWSCGGRCASSRWTSKAPSRRCSAARRGLLQRDRPLILSELHPTQLERASGITAGQFLAQIAAFGYRAHRIEHAAIGAPIAHAPADALVSIVLVPM